MKKKIYIILSVMLFIFSGMGAISVMGETNGTSFDVFSNAVLSLIKDENIEDYANSVFDLKQDVLEVDNSLMVELKNFESVTKSEVNVLNNAVEIKNNENVLLIENNKINANEEEQIVTNNYVKTINNKLYINVEVASRYLGFEVRETSNKLILSSPYKTKRIIVKSNKKIDSKNACKKVEGYNGLHFFEYKTISECKSAYEYFLSQDVEWAEVDSYYSIYEEPNNGSCDINSQDDFSKSAGTQGSSYQDNNQDKSYLDSSEYKNTSAVIMGKNDSFSYSSWGAKAMGVENYSNYLLNSNKPLNEVIVAVLDTGLDSDHSWFTGRVKAGGKNYSLSSSKTSFEYEDVNGHGTHVAGTIVDLTLDNVKILPIKVLDDNGSGLTSNIILGLEYVVGLKNKTQIAQGASAIDDSYSNIVTMNLSFGGSGLGTSVNGDSYNKYGNILTSAYSSNILPVVAAGNDGEDCINTTPANIDCAITVSAVGQAGDSNYFRPYWSNYGINVDVCAPGEDIISAKVGGGVTPLDGTSMASPHVAGVVALLYSGGNSISEIETILTEKSLDLGVTGKDVYFGSGLCYIEYAYADLLSDEIIFSSSTQNNVVKLTMSQNSTDTSALTKTSAGLPTSASTSTDTLSRIYYTLNGKSPTITSNYYNGEITISETTVIKARIFVLSGDDVVSYSNEFSKAIIINNKDIASAYTVENGVLVSYNGVFENVTVPNITENNEVITTIGERAFIASNPLTVTLDSGITSLNKFAFYGCTNLTKVVASGVVDIGRYAFFYCENLKFVTNEQFPVLKNIDKYAFANCSSIKDIYLNNVELVDYNAFFMANEAENLTSVTLPKVRVIGDYAFYNCGKLTQVSLPLVEIIGSKSFLDCDISLLNLPSVEYLGNQCFENNSNLTSANLQNVLQVGSQCFYGCSKLSSVNISKVKVIASLAFARTSLTQIDMPQVESVGVEAFYNCSKLTSFYAPNLKEIKTEAFYNCSGLTEINLPSVVSIEKEAFYGLNNLGSVTLSPTLTYISFCAFNSFNDDCVFYIYASTPAKEFVTSDSRIKYEELDENKSLFNYEVIRGREVYIKGINYSQNIEEIVIPSFIENLPVTKICAEAFKNCDLIKKLQASNLKEIESSAFENCQNLVSVYLPKIEIIGSRAFYGCKKINNINIENVTAIKEYAFYNCNNLLEIKLGNNISEIRTKSLGYVNNLVPSTFRLFGYEGVASKYANDNGISTFHNIYSDLSGFYYGYYNNNGSEEIYISLVDGYTTGGVKIPATINSVPVSKIGDSAFEDCVLITDVYLPSSITTIGYKAFYYCSNLKNINLNYVTSIEANSFSRCENLQSVTLSKITEIPTGAFAFCYGLETINLPEVISIGDQAFYCCFGLISVISPKLEEIGYAGFQECYKLKNINLSNVKMLGTKGTNSSGNIAIDGSVFYNCYELGEYVYLPNIEEIGDQLFNNTNVLYVVIGKNFKAYSSGLLTPSIASKIIIYGYSGTFAQTYASRFGNEFREIPNFEILNNTEKTINCSEFETCYISVSVTGLGLQYEWYNLDTNLVIENETEKDLYIDTSKTGTTRYYCIVTSWNGESLTSANFIVNVAPAYEIEIVCSSRGKVTPSVAGRIKQNSNVTLFITANEGCFVTKIIVDGVTLTQEQMNNAVKNGYTFKNVTANHTFEVEFGINYYTISVICGENGGVSNTLAEVEHGAYYTFYFTADKGYHVSDIKVDNISVGTGNSYTFLNVKENHILQVEFSENKYTINVLHNSYGSLECDLSLQNIDEGDNRTFTISVQEGYYVKSVKYNNVELEIEDNTFTISNISSDITLEVDFKKIATEEDNLQPENYEDVLIWFGIIAGIVVVIVAVPMFLLRKKNR